jgi:5'-methylthioadenosine phosphorylase
MIGIIGGSGVYNLSNIEVIDTFNISTPFGEASDAISKIRINSSEMFFLPRHGKNHKISPTAVNYRANIFALKSLGCNSILSFSACGSLNEKYHPGDFVLVDQYLDLTRKRHNSFFEEDIIAHVSMAEPSCNRLRDSISKILKKLKINHHNGGSYVAIEGPQFSSKKESLIYKNVFNCDVIGMTNMPEAKLAREAEICYQTIAMITDFDCWKVDAEHVSYDEIQKIFKDNLSKVEKILFSLSSKTLKLEGDNCYQGCNNSLESGLVTDVNNLDKKILQNFELLVRKYIK